MANTQARMTLEDYGIILPELTHFGRQQYLAALEEKLNQWVFESQLVDRNIINAFLAEIKRANNAWRYYINPLPPRGYKLPRLQEYERRLREYLEGAGVNTIRNPNLEAKKQRSANWKQQSQDLQPRLNVPRGSLNSLTYEAIQNGNSLVNFPTTFNKEGRIMKMESNFGRYYRPSTINRIQPRIHPQTRTPILNTQLRYYTARVVNNNKTKNNSGKGAGAGSGGAKKTRKNRKNKTNRR